MSEEYKEEEVSSPEQDFILFLIYCVVMRAKVIRERHFRLYIGNGNWVTLPQHVSDDLQTIYRNGLPVRYTLGPGLALDILPNDMDCNSRTACLPGLMRVDLCYNGLSNTEAGQQALSRYVKQILENQGTMDAFPPPSVMRSTKEHFAENEDVKEEETGDVLSMPHVLSLPSHRHLSLVPPLPPTGANRRRIPTTLPSHRYGREAGDDVPIAPPFPHLRKRPPAPSPSQIKRRQLHSPAARCLTTYGTGPRVPPTVIHFLHDPENAEPAQVFSHCGGGSSSSSNSNSNSNSIIDYDTMATDHHSNPPATLWPNMGQAANDMVQYNGIVLPLGYFPHHHNYTSAHGEHPPVVTTPGYTSSSMVTTLSYPLSDLSSPPESVIMRHNSMNADIETHCELESILQSQLSMVDRTYFVSNSHL